MNQEEEIKKVIHKLRPYLQRDGGDIEFIKFEDGIVYVTKDGSESGQTAKTFAVDVSWMETDGKTDENGKETMILKVTMEYGD